MNPEFTAVIVDDEPLARRYLQELLAEFPSVRIVATCADGFDAVKAVNQHRPNLLFLDIQMPRLDGFEVLELIDTSSLAVVFVTAFDQYALRAFDAHAVDYLLKPFSRDRLAVALEKVQRNLGGGLPEVSSLRRTFHPDSPYVDRLVVKDGQAVTIIDCREIRCILSEDDYVNIRCVRGEHLKLQSLSSLEASLDPARFVRIHRGAILNIDHLAQVEQVARDHQVAILKDGTELRVSRSGQQRLRELFR